MWQPDMHTERSQFLAYIRFLLMTSNVSNTLHRQFHVGYISNEPVCHCKGDEEAQRIYAITSP